MTISADDKLREDRDQFRADRERLRRLLDKSVDRQNALATGNVALSERLAAAEDENRQLLEANRRLIEKSAPAFDQEDLNELAQRVAALVAPHVRSIVADARDSYMLRDQLSDARGQIRSLEHDLTKSQEAYELAQDRDQNLPPNTATPSTAPDTQLSVRSDSQTDSPSTTSPENRVAQRKNPDLIPSGLRQWMSRFNSTVERDGPIVRCWWLNSKGDVRGAVASGGARALVLDCMCEAEREETEIFIATMPDEYARLMRSPIVEILASFRRTDENSIATPTDPVDEGVRRDDSRG